MTSTHFVTKTFSLDGEMPSKKNAWKHGASGRVYVGREMAAELDAFLWQLKEVKIKDHGIFPVRGPVELQATFYGDDKRDLDNMLTTLQDLLQKGGVIENDKNIYAISCKKFKATKHPHVDIELTYAE